MKITRMKVGEWGKVRAFFDLETSEGFIIKGFKLIEGINGIFVSNPSIKNKEGEYEDSVFVRKDARITLSKLALECFKDGGRELIIPKRRSGGISEVATQIEEREQGNYLSKDDDIPF